MLHNVPTPEVPEQVTAALTLYRQLIDRGVDRSVALAAVIETTTPSQDDATLATIVRALLAEQQAAVAEAADARVTPEAGPAEGSEPAAGPLHTVGQVAAATGMHAADVRRMIASGDITTVSVGGRVRVADRQLQILLGADL